MKKLLTSCLLLLSIIIYTQVYYSGLEGVWRPVHEGEYRKFPIERIASYSFTGETFNIHTTDGISLKLSNFILIDKLGDLK